MRVHVYARTLLEFEWGPCLPLDQPLADSLRGALTRHVRARAFAVITAYDPDGRVVPELQNVEADGRLRRELRDRVLEFCKVIGRALDGSHWAQSAAISTPLEDASEPD